MEGKPLCCVLTPGRLGAFRHCPQRGSGVCEEVWMCLWEDFIFLVLVKPFLSRIPPCPVLFLQPGPVPAGPRCGVGITTSLLSHRDFFPHPTAATEPRRDQTRSCSLILTLGCCREASGPHNGFPAPKIRVFLLERRKGIPTLALLNLTQPGPFPWEPQTLCG